MKMQQKVHQSVIIMRSNKNRLPAPVAPKKAICEKDMKSKVVAKKWLGGQEMAWW